MRFRRIVVLTGAGISAESGIKTFRDHNGLWENHCLEDVATLEGFEHNPKLVYHFYNERRRQLFNPKNNPNPAHFRLAELGLGHGDNFTLITQNVDNLHERAGSENVIHMHGELLSARCIRSGETQYHAKDFDEDSLCQCCQPASKIRPDIVWFGEIPKYMNEIEKALWHCDLFVAIGTSGNVYPAAGFVQLANQAGAHTVELNLEHSVVKNQFSEGYYGLASDIVPRFFNKII